MEKDKTIFWIIGIIIGAIIIWKFGFFGSQFAAFGTGSGNILATPVLLSEDANGAVYQISWSGDSYSSGAGDAEIFSASFSIPVNWYTNHGESDLPKFVLGLDTSKYFNTNLVTLGGYNVITGYQTCCPSSGNLVFDELSASCKITDLGMNNGLQRAGMNCIVNGKIHVVNNMGQNATGSVAGFSNGNIIVTIYKIGYEPSQTYYRLGNNVCSSITIPLSQKTTNDYLTLSECQTHIISCISRSQLITYINQWASGTITREVLGNKIQEWGGC